LVITEAVAADKYAIAQQVANIEITVLQSAGNKAEMETAICSATGYQNVETSYLQSKVAIDAVANGAQGPKKIRRPGKFYCFVKGDWERGIPMLAKAARSVPEAAGRAGTRQTVRPR